LTEVIVQSSIDADMVAACVERYAQTTRNGRSTHLGDTKNCAALTRS
jgi:hypothetical protein